MRVAAIDCGTNSIRLLIADIEGSSFREVTRLMEVVRLGQGVDKTGAFHPDAIARTLAAVDLYAAEIAKRGVEKIRFCATSATRDATNRALFIDGVKERLGIEPEVIAGEVEAALSFQGATKDFDKSQGPFLVIDIGGGSTEFVLMVAGTATTVAAAALDLSEYDRYAIHLARIPATRAHEISQQLLRETREQRAAHGYMHPGRVDVIGAGSLVLDRIMKASGATEFVASESDILDGMAWSLV